MFSVMSSELYLNSQSVIVDFTTIKSHDQYIYLSNIYSQAFSDIVFIYTDVMMMTMMINWFHFGEHWFVVNSWNLRQFNHQISNFICCRSVWFCWLRFVRMFLLLIWFSIVVPMFRLFLFMNCLGHLMVGLIQCVAFVPIRHWFPILRINNFRCHPHCSQLVRIQA